MEIEVHAKDVQKLVRLEVGESHQVGEVIDEIIEALNLPRNGKYFLVLESQVIGRERYSSTMRDLGLNDGDHLTLTSRAIEETLGPPEDKSRVQGIGISRRRFFMKIRGR